MTCITIPKGGSEKGDPTSKGNLKVKDRSDPPFWNSLWGTVNIY